MSHEKIKSLVLQLPNLMDVEYIDQARSNDIWSIVNNSDNEITIQYLQQKNEILVSINNDVQFDALSLDNCQLLLQFNFIYKDTGGAHFSISPEDNSVHLQLGFTADLSLVELVKIIDSLTDLKYNWSRLLVENNEPLNKEETKLPGSIILC